MERREEIILGNYYLNSTLFLRNNKDEGRKDVKVYNLAITELNDVKVYEYSDYFMDQITESIKNGLNEGHN